jgi:hypothetical protein
MIKKKQSMRMSRRVKDIDEERHIQDRVGQGK